MTVLGYLAKLGVFGVIQFCSTVFAYYAQATAAQEIFGHTLQSLRGIKYLYKYNIFQIAFVVLAGLTFLYYAAFVWRRKKPSGRFQLSSQMSYNLYIIGSNYKEGFKGNFLLIDLFPHHLYVLLLCPVLSSVSVVRS
ncbi:LIMR family protein At5g01460-like isoform X2 [Rutidosis leptorrhynchoides]|uniref:LIMR family protein At5g01460-like isoform X2 n=1 Tax=Rutidosis leptorrhynchoides TaxID=125765 RepID=UPI003A99205F